MSNETRYQLSTVARDPGDSGGPGESTLPDCAAPMRERVYRHRVSRLRAFLGTCLSLGMLLALAWAGAIDPYLGIVLGVPGGPILVYSLFRALRALRTPGLYSVVVNGLGIRRLSASRDEVLRWGDIECARVDLTGVLHLTGGALAVAVHPETQGVHSLSRAVSDFATSLPRPRLPYKQCRSRIELLGRGSLVLLLLALALLLAATGCGSWVHLAYAVSAALALLSQVLSLPMSILVGDEYLEKRWLVGRERLNLSGLKVVTTEKDWRSPSPWLLLGFREAAEAIRPPNSRGWFTLFLALEDARRQQLTRLRNS